MYTKIVDDNFLEELYRKLKEDGIQKIVEGSGLELRLFVVLFFLF